MVIKNIKDTHFIKKSNSYYIEDAKPNGGLLMVKVDWCSFCKNTLPILEDLSKKLGKAYPIYKLDGDSNAKLVKELGVMGFPTLFYINKDGKVGKKFDGERTVSSLLSGICKEALVCKK